QVVELEPENLTVTVQAGATPSVLDEVLRPHGLRLPVRALAADDSTIGGQIARNASGPARLASRTYRDWLIGVRVVLANGELARIGGKVMKNVSGYDLTKLYVGSRGAFGAILEATIRLQPLPETTRWLLVRPDTSATAERFVVKLMRSLVHPAALELLGGPDAGPALRLLVELAGFREDVDAHLGVASDLASDLTIPAAEIGAAESAAILAEIQAIHTGDSCRIRAGAPRSRLEELWEAVGALESAVGIAAHAGDGVVLAAFPTSPARAAIEQLRQRTTDFGGYAIVEAGPPDLRRDFAFPDSNSERPVLTSLKVALDPDTRFSPGRLPIVGSASAGAL
ncbi:MAG: FAD-binding oxidoreductase, partial [Chloroflexi bacterium]|nr:FAD-binding oxidoreductase [Chloroflexota bacterium]